MQQRETLRDRAIRRGGWLRVGLVSTTVVAPLIARWTELRAANRLAAWRLEAQARASGASALLSTARQAGIIGQAFPMPAQVRRAADRRGERVRTGLWLAGVGIGLVTAGAAAYFIARKRLAASVEQPLIERAAQARTDAAEAAAPSASGATLTMDRAGASGAALTVPPPASFEEFELAAVVEPGMPEPELATARGGDQDHAAPAFVGNIHTMIYHDIVDAEHLPAEENRVYFASEDEARGAGYRRDRQEVPPPASEVRASEGQPS